MKQRGFTLIELVVVIVILGILAATALPKFVNLSVDAERAAAQGVLGAAQSACAIQFAKNRATNVAPTLVDGATVFAALDPVPTGWVAAAPPALTIAKTASGVTFTLTVTAETTTAPCKVVLTEV